MFLFIINCVYCVLFLAKHCDLETSQAAENKEEQQQMLKRIECAKDVQIFNLERKLSQKSHVSKQHAVKFSASMCNAIYFILHAGTTIHQ